MSRPDPAPPHAFPARLRRSRGLGALVLAVLLAGACSSWRPLRTYEGWTLYVRDASTIEPTHYAAAFDPAFTAVAAVFGPFTGHVRVHAWKGGVHLDEGSRGRIREGNEGPVHEVEGIGPARVQAFHSRGSGLARPGGVFIGAAEVGTAVHELVHARIAELGLDLPLWLEEGLASLLGDGALFEDRWVVDGLACWPLRELVEARIDDVELARLLSLRPSDNYSVRENVLVHFVGWALVFDLLREEGDFGWKRWIARYRSGMPLTEARRRLDRTLDRDTPSEWMARLESEEPGVRLAAAKGVWKLRDRRVLVAVLRAIDAEEHPEVKVALAVNALAAAGETSLDRRTRRLLWRTALVTLRRAELRSEEEEAAAHALYFAYRYGAREGSTQEALDHLRRFWAE